MWFNTTVFEKFRESVKDFYDVLFVEKDDDGSQYDEDEERYYDSNENLMSGETCSNEPKKASNLQTFWNIFNANQGVVILSMPYVVLSGTYLSLIFTAIVATMSNYTSK
uniref:Uncharacterized protein n=2 Tax=Clytia hemisphaerica TaxID=252671 RepID=A0A7M6DL25_9CNID